MRALPIIKNAVSALGAGMLAGCLVAEAEILTARNGGAKPLRVGDYEMCPIEEGVVVDECQSISVTLREDKAYILNSAEEDGAIEMRFRRVGRKSYAAQQWGSGDGGYIFYFAHGDRRSMHFSMMMCAALPAELRKKLVAGGDLSLEDEEFGVCSVNSLKGLVRAAKAYRDGKVSGEEELAFVLSLQASNAQANE